MKLAAITYENGSGHEVDALFAETALRLRGQGLKLAGAAQWNQSAPDECDLVLEDLATGRRFEANPGRSPGDRGCRLDASVLEDLAGLVASSISPAVDLVIINKFGKEEAAGRGFRSVIEAAGANDLPVLTSLSRAHRELFGAFAGHEAVELPPVPAAVDLWCKTVLAAK